MAIKRQESSIDLPAAGTVPARLARIIELGKQESLKFQSTTEFVVKEEVILFYSLPTRLIDSPNSEYDGKQHFIRTGTMNMSSNERSSLRSKHIDILDPGFFSRDELDMGTLLGKPMYLTIVHNEGKDNKVYANITNTMSVPEGMVVDELDTTPFYFDFDNPDPQVWDNHLADWYKEKIQGAVNFSGSAVEKMLLARG